MNKILQNNSLSPIALFAVIAGAAGSVVFTLIAGHNNKSVLLVLLFVIWVLSPFVAMVVAAIHSRSWSVRMRSILLYMMIFLTLASIICYSGVMSPPGVKPGFVFLVIPLISWLVLLIIFLTVSVGQRRLNK